jgi:hypothetical protein
MHISYRLFISSFQQQPNLSLQSLILDLLQEETFMKKLGSASYSLNALYVGKRPTPTKFKNNKFLMKNSFQSKGKDPHTLFDKKNTIKTTKTRFYCKKIGHLIKDYNKRIATKVASRKQQSNNIVTHNEKLYVTVSNFDFFSSSHQQ